MKLDGRFHDPVRPADFPRHEERFFNRRWAERVGFAAMNDEERVRRFARFEPFEDGLSEPLALRYHGHQFRVYNPDIGDGRGFLYAQAEDLIDGRLLDFGTKGSGRTPFSRSGDGRLTLKGAVREVLAASMLEALGVYTSKAFAVFETGEPLYRGDEPSPTRSAVLTRLSHSHIRFGTFQRMAAVETPDALAALAVYALENLIDAPGSAAPARRLLEAAAAGSAELVASWMAAGFVHGVLNTDNMNVTGESFDYGPWRFLPRLEYGFTAAYFDHQGLYAFGRQPDAVYWNLARLAEPLLEIADKAELEAALDVYPDAFRSALIRRTIARLGLAPLGLERDGALARAWFAFLESSPVGFEDAHFDHWAFPIDPDRADLSLRDEHYRGEAYDAFKSQWDGYAPVRPDALDDPYFKRDHPVRLLVDDVEGLWSAIDKNDDWRPFNAKLAEIDAARRAFAFDPDEGRADRALARIRASGPA